MSNIRLLDCHFFLQLDYWNIEYQTGKFEKLSGYLIRSRANLLDYHILGSHKLLVAQLCSKASFMHGEELWVK